MKLTHKHSKGVREHVQTHYTVKGKNRQVRTERFRAQKRGEPVKMALRESRGAHTPSNGVKKIPTVMEQSKTSAFPQTSFLQECCRDLSKGRTKRDQTAAEKEPFLSTCRFDCHSRSYNGSTRV